MMLSCIKGALGYYEADANNERYLLERDLRRFPIS